EPLDKRRRPDNAAAAANSIPFCVAKSLVHGSVTLEDVTSGGLRDAVALALAQRTACRFDDTIKGAIVRVRTQAGDLREAKVETPLGHTSRPVPRARRLEKFRDCCRHAGEGMPMQSVESIITMIDGLAELDDVRRIMRASAATG